MTEIAYTPTQRTEQGRIQSIGSGGRAQEATSSGVVAMRQEASAAAQRGDLGKAKRITENLAQVERTLGR